MRDTESRPTFESSAGASIRSSPRDVPLAAMVAGARVELFATGGWSSASPRNAAEARRLLGAVAGGAHETEAGVMFALAYEFGAIADPAGGYAPPVLPPVLWAACAPAPSRDHSPLDTTPPWSASVDDRASESDRYQSLVGRALGYIAAGDTYQVNLSHAIRGSFRGSSRSMFADLIERASPAHGAYVEFDLGDTRHAVLSLSPELFLRVDPSGLVTTRPMKGTRPLSDSPDELLASPKDAAELAMIVDLLRNDIGRSCELGSVRVSEPRVLERHDSGVWQTTSTIEGRLRTGIGELLVDAFPPGSITGVPKIRATQIIHELEREPRGPYCGSIGIARPDRSLSANVAIRTLWIKGPKPGGTRDLDHFDDATFEYRVGAGIVADSDPHAEWMETQTKASGLLRVIERNAAASPSVPA